MGKKYKWADVEVEELYKFLGLLILLHSVVCAVSSHCHDKRQIQGYIMEHPPQ